MPATNSNNATWYILRYATDFAPRPVSPVDPAPPQFVPSSAPTLYYDDTRNVLELLPVKAAQELPPPPGLAIDIDGEIYRVVPSTQQLLVRRCNGCETPLLCEPGILRSPYGLALDRRGFLYVADPGLARVVVILPDDASSVAILTTELREPVDVAVAPGGKIYIADRTAGRIVIYDAAFRQTGSFVPQDANLLPATPRPVAVMIDSDGSVLVADASYPRLLRFSVQGSPLGDVNLSTLVKPLEALGISLDNPLSLLAGPTGRFVAGACRPPFAADDGAVLLAQIHRYLRLLLLKLNHSFQTQGVVLTTVFDSRAPGTMWHKVVVDASLPPDTWITVETSTAENVTDLVSQLAGPLAGADLTWNAPKGVGGPATFTKLVPDQLVQSPPGRYLRMRITLGSNGSATPSLRWLKVYYPRVSYLDLLPKVYQRDPDSALFLQHFLALFERVFTGVEDRYEEFSRWLNPKAAPLEIIDWLGLLVDLTFDPSWSLARRRMLVSEAMELYRHRGTVAGLKRYIEIYTGVVPVILEAFLSRPAQPAMVGLGNSFLGGSFSLSASSAEFSPARALSNAYASRFTVLVYADDECEAKTLLPVVNRIVTVNKPAHTIHTLRAIYPDAQVGVRSTVGLDYVIGGGTASFTKIGGKPKAGQPNLGASVLGVDSVLGNLRPQYARPVTQEL
ncbi:MAG TPA: phage tail protein [Verrucomicrobiae bacterium]|jgi:phage tail-like protein